MAVRHRPGIGNLNAPGAGLRPPLQSGSMPLVAGAGGSAPAARHRRPPAREDESADPVGNGRTEPDGSPVPPPAAAPRPPGARRPRPPATRRARP